MNAGKTVFAQILEHLPRYEFDKFVKKYEGNHRVRKFPCYDQFLCLAYAQLVSAGENVPPLSGERCPPEAGEVVDEAQISSDESCVARWSNVMSVCSWHIR
ncbi:MAG: DUF4372 domain-containing protein [Proteobacteria bacterium]|nr:DUF4372 domain-containing protein [Pseudomonadota bacterium]MBU2227816.1 DUF4372 domain-containing protein [Pseudomonadota bacterium]MBU2261651.1 DUF4372 domain-containing protein [Pseudomonadota bacterium]